MRQKIKVLLCYLLISQLFLMTVYAEPEWPSDTGIEAQAGIVIDADSGAVLFGQNIHVAYPPASITKLLTALIVLENSKLGDTVTFSKDAIYDVEAGSGNKLNVTVGDQLSVEDCLYSMLLHSCNQAANALAEQVAGSREEFVRMMNEKLVELGCTESHFENPSGLNGDDQYVTAYDMSLIAKAAFNNKELVKISSSLKHKMPPTTNNPDGLTIYNEHRLIKTKDSDSPYYYPAAVAGKTGYLIKAGNTLVTYAKKDGRRLISVILKGQPRQYFVDGKNLLEFGFNNFKNVSINKNETEYTKGNTPVSIGEVSYQPSELELQSDSVITLPNNAKFDQTKKTLITDLPSNRPKRAVAIIEYTYHDRKIGQAYLLTKKEDTSQGTNGASEASGAESDKKVQKDSKKKGSTGRLLAIAGIIAILSAGSTGAGIFISRKLAEARRIAIRREERRKRLKADGDEEAFEKILQERRQSKRKK